MYVMNQVIQESEVKMLALKSEAFLTSLKLGERFCLKTYEADDKTLYANVDAQKVLRKNEFGTSVFHVELKFNWIKEKPESKRKTYITLPIKELAVLINVGVFHLV